MAHRLGNLVLGLLPRVEAHVGIRRETHDLHGHGVRVRGDVVRQYQYGPLARTKSRVTVNTKSALERYIAFRKESTIAVVISGRRAHSGGPQPLMLLV
jgi:hypothetical protein